VARVDRSGNWTVNTDTGAVEAAVQRVAAERKLKVSRKDPSTFQLSGGSLVRTRLVGAWLSGGASLPTRGTVELSSTGDSGLTVSVNVEESIGVGLLDRRTREKYERVLDGIVASFGSEFGKLGAE
jgi:hypothetical protein